MKRPTEYHPPTGRTIHDEREWAHKTNMLRRNKRVRVTLASVGGVDYEALAGKLTAVLTGRQEP